MSLLKTILTSTKYTLLVCFVFLLATLFIEGSFFDYFKMKKQKEKISQEIKSIEIKAEDVKKKLEKVNDPKFVEKQIKERFDFVEEGDLVFIFSDKD